MHTATSRPPFATVLVLLLLLLSCRSFAQTPAIGTANVAPAGQLLAAQMVEQVQHPATATPSALWLLAGSLLLLSSGLSLLSLRREKEFAHA